VRTLLEYGADIEAQTNVRDQMMMIMMIMTMINNDLILDNDYKSSIAVDN
jgi:hypothetical protein